MGPPAGGSCPPRSGAGSTPTTANGSNFLREIVRVPSDTPPGDNAPAAEKAAALLTVLGFTVERHPVPAQILRGYGMKSVTNLIVRERFGEGGPTIALNAHGDVVPPGDGWTKLPYEGAVENGRMYGRGVAVSKSDIATYAYALSPRTTAACSSRSPCTAGRATARCRRRVATRSASASSS